MSTLSHILLAVEFVLPKTLMAWEPKTGTGSGGALVTPVVSPIGGEHFATKYRQTWLWTVYFPCNGIADHVVQWRGWCWLRCRQSALMASSAATKWPITLPTVCLLLVSVSAIRFTVRSSSAGIVFFFFESISILLITDFCSK